MCVVYSLLKLLRVKRLPQYMRDFCVDMITRTVEERERTNIVRKDLMQYLIQLRNETANTAKAGDNEWNFDASGRTQFNQLNKLFLFNLFQLAKTIKSLSYEQIAAQIFIFYIAGNETSSSTVAYMMYELAKNKLLLARACEDIKSTLARHGGELTYESIGEMKFIDLCVKETLRKYPGLPILNRECTKNYRIPGTNFTIEKGTPIIVSLLGIHRDAQFFPDPECFNPDRFTDENRAYDEEMYMPFGIGPRNCLGDFCFITQSFLVINSPIL